MRGRPAFASEPNLQLLRAFHYHDKTGEGLISTFAVGSVLGQLGVQMPSSLTSDLLLQSLVEGETTTLWNQSDTSGAAGGGSGGGSGGGGGGGAGKRMVDYHTFLSLVLARTQLGFGDHHSAVARQDTEFRRRAVASAAAAVVHSPGFSHDATSSVVVDVATGLPVPSGSAAGLAQFSVAVRVSTHAHGAVAAAIGSNAAAVGGLSDPSMAGLLGQDQAYGLGGSGGTFSMAEGSPSFLEFKARGEKGFKFTIHKIKWPKAAAALHRAVGVSECVCERRRDGWRDGGREGVRSTMVSSRQRDSRRKDI